MKIQQEHLPFRPITIKLESVIEAKGFFGLVDKIDDSQINLNDWERAVLLKLSNARTNQEIIILK